MTCWEGEEKSTDLSEERAMRMSTDNICRIFFSPLLSKSLSRYVYWNEALGKKKKIPRIL